MHNAKQLTFEFAGRGGEYFRIWIVNTCLSIITLGIYSAWAKVRRNQYLYRHTLLDGSSFDYHGDPENILKGRIIATILSAIYLVAFQLDPLMGQAVLGLIMIVLPWLLVRSLCFKLHNTSYRGLRFAFHGNAKGAFANLVFPSLAGFLSLGVLWPWAKYRMVGFVRKNSAYGSLPFNFEASTGVFYRVYMMVIPILIFIFVLLMSTIYLLGSLGAVPIHEDRLTIVSSMAAALGTYLALFVLIMPYLEARLQNLIWSQTTLGAHQFSASLRARDLFWIMSVNLFLIVVTLGFYKPYAEIRLLRYKLEHIHLLPDGDLDEITAGLFKEASAAGEEITDMFDFDVSL